MSLAMTVKSTHNHLRKLVKTKSNRNVHFKRPSTNLLLSLALTLYIIQSMVTILPTNSQAKKNLKDAALPGAVIGKKVVNPTTSGQTISEQAISEQAVSEKMISKQTTSQQMTPSQRLKVVSAENLPINNFPTGRRIYTTNMLPGFKQNNPCVYPPGFGVDAINRVIIDVGANVGQAYTFPAYRRGHTVLSFEASPMVAELFKQYMEVNNVSLSVGEVRAEDDAPIADGDSPGQTETEIRRKVVIPSRDENDDAQHVFLFPCALSNVSEVIRFHQSPCRPGLRCGTGNHVLEGEQAKKKGLQVQSFRLDDLILPVDARQIWFLKIDVEGFESRVLQGARNLIKESKVDYIAIEFSANHRYGIDWGIELFQELYGQGYVCFHLRGFGQCHDENIKSPSLKCNYPFSTTNESLAPTFEEYSKVYELKKGKEKERPPLSDLMCKRIV